MDARVEPQADRIAADQGEGAEQEPLLFRLSESELDAYAERKAANEVVSSAWEGVVLDQEALKAELLEAYRELRTQRNVAGASTIRL